MKIKTSKRDTLVIVDVQNDFCPGGALEEMVVAGAKLCESGDIVHPWRKR